MNTDQEHYDALLALLLDGQKEGGPDYARAREQMLRDPAFRREAESLLAIGERLSQLGDAMHGGLPEVSLVEDLQDSIAHLAMEELAVANASPFGPIEHALADLKQDWDAKAGSVSLVDDIMAAVAASRMTDDEVEMPFRRETARLRALGEDIAAKSPWVDLLQPVAAELDRRKPSSVVPLRARPAAGSTIRVPASGRNWRHTLAWAAAAVFCVAGAWFTYIQVSSGPASTHEVAGNVGTDPEAPAPEPFSEVPPLVIAATPSPGTDEPASDELPTPERTGVRQPDKQPLTLQELLNAKRADAVNDTQLFAALGAMTKEEVLALLKDMDLSVEALIGATQFLSPEEAIAVLRAAVEENPDDPHLRYALAQSLGENPDTLDERMAQLNQMAAKDPENGLPHFMLASDYLARGETDLAMDALTRGSAYTGASAYALEAARQREAAYIANGFDPDVARLLALSTSGQTEYADIATLRNELLDYGAYYEGLGDTDTARQIYNAVSELGQQLAVSADLAVERQYGLETQQEAILAFQGIAEVLQDPQVSAWIGDTLTSLASSLADVAQYIQASQELVVNPSLTAQVDWTGYLEHVIRHGDLNITEFLQ